MDSDMAADSQDSVQNLAVTRREVYGDVFWKQIKMVKMAGSQESTIMACNM